MFLQIENRKVISTLLVVGLLVSMMSCGSSETVEQPKEEHSESNLKEVELNEAQYNASGIQLGDFEMKNLSAVINANGYTKLPPQNQADVSVLLGGIIKKINIIEGQFVKEGQALSIIENLEFTKIQEAYLTSKSNLELLTLEYERQKTLNEGNANSKKILQKAKSEFEVEKARFNSLKKQMNTMHLSSSENATSSMVITAPISGYITDINVKIGTNAEPGQVLFSIVDNSKMHVDLLVYEKDLQKVKVGQTINFILTNQNNTEIKGKVFSIGKAFENETKSVAVHADIINEQQTLIPGMYVNALINVGTQAVKAVPVEAVVKADGREFIFILEESNEDGHEQNHDDAEGHSHEDGHQHEEEAGHDEETEHDKEAEHGKSFHFQRVEVKTGTTQLGFIQVTPLNPIPKNAQIVLKGAYYIQSHLLKSEGGGGHEH
jgi:cobalt-zinc-cadmium efflux system membrane fusion protein